MEIEVSNGEIVDKITILQIKRNNITDNTKLHNITKELDYLLDILKLLDIKEDTIEFKELYKVNNLLWDVEDFLRKKESIKEFNQEFIELARQVYYLNDKRAEIKRNINTMTKSNFVEEKSYEKY